jgi:3-hydroxy-D-aspartate aldolase
LLCVWGNDMQAMLSFKPPQTPALVVDHAALLENLKIMQEACDTAGVRLRAHGKMHKCSTLGHLQVTMGAVGICCQTVGEAEAYARSGINDVLVTSPLPPWGAERLARLQVETNAHIACVADSVVQIERLGAAAQNADVTLGCMVDVNINMHRSGVQPSQAAVLAAEISNRTGLRYDGIQAYFGHLQHADNRVESNASETAEVRNLVDVLRAHGLAPPQVTGGGTGTFAFDLAAGVFTEVQCGSYALMDAEYMMCAGPNGPWPFKPALFIVSSVVSAQHKRQVTTDLGMKAVSLDVAPRVIAGAALGSYWDITELSDEHGIIVHPDLADSDIPTADADANITWPPDAPKEGTLVWFQPGHCDPTINLYDGFWVVGNAKKPEFWPIDARRVTPRTLIDT